MGEDIRSKKSTIKKVIKIISKILYQILVALCLIVAAIIVFQKITNNNKSIGGYRIFRVITGSMEPEYDVGEVVISKEVDPNSIEVGDDIVYLGTYGEYKGKIIMHSVVAIDKDENGNLNFHAKGLHSSSVVKYKSIILTVLYKLATNIYSLFIIITILALNVFISFWLSGKEKVQKLAESTYSAQDAENSEYEDLDDEEDYEEEQEEYDDEFEDSDIDEDETEDTGNGLDDEKDEN